jgi:exodeoxyribonuclease V alpha subunit
MCGIGFKPSTPSPGRSVSRSTACSGRAGIHDFLSEAAEDGHWYLPEPTLIAAATTILAVPADLVRSRSGIRERTFSAVDLLTC